MIKIVFIIFFTFLLSTLFAQPKWIVFPTSQTGVFIRSIAVDKNNNIWICSDALYKYNWTTWQRFDSTNSPLPRNSVRSVSIDTNNNVWVAIDYYGVGKFNGSSWTFYDTTNAPFQSTRFFCSHVDNFNNIYVGAAGVQKFNGSTWKIWNVFNSGIPNGSIESITSQSDTLWVGTFNKGIARLVDTTWTKFTFANSPLPNDDAWNIHHFPSTGIWAGTRFGGIANISYNYTWTIYNTQNSGLPGNSILAYTEDSNTQWFGTEVWGLTRFKNNIWHTFNDTNSPLPSYTILKLKHDNNGNLWIGAAGGVVVYNENGVVGIQNQTTTVNTFVLYQNYPNPFNPITKIKFSIQNYDKVKLYISDISGKIVSTLTNKIHNFGNYEYIFNAESLPSGIYFYTLETSMSKETKKMLLIK